MRYSSFSSSLDRDVVKVAVKVAELPVQDSPTPTEMLVGITFLTIAVLGLAQGLI